MVAWPGGVAGHIDRWRFFVLVGRASLVVFVCGQLWCARAGGRDSPLGAGQLLRSRLAPFFFVPPLCVRPSTSLLTLAPLPPLCPLPTGAAPKWPPLPPTRCGGTRRTGGRTSRRSGSKRCCRASPPSLTRWPPPTRTSLRSRGWPSCLWGTLWRPPRRWRPSGGTAPRGTRGSPRRRCSPSICGYVWWWGGVRGCLFLGGLWGGLASVCLWDGCLGIWRMVSGLGRRGVAMRSGTPVWATGFLTYESPRCGGLLAATRTSGCGAPLRPPPFPPTGSVPAAAAGRRLPHHRPASGVVSELASPAGADGVSSPPLLPSASTLVLDGHAPR